MDDFKDLDVYETSMTTTTLIRLMDSFIPVSNISMQVFSEGINYQYNFVFFIKFWPQISDANY